MSFRLFSRQLEVNHSLWDFLIIFITANRSILSADISHFKVDKDKDKYFKREKSDVHTDLHITIDQVCGSLRPSANAPAPTPLNIPLLPSAACCLLCPLSSDILYPLSGRTRIHSILTLTLTSLILRFLQYHIMSCQAILGSSADVRTLDGAVTMKINPGTQPGSTFSITGKGISKVNSASSRRWPPSPRDSS
jgi:hypothetical protein